MTTSLFVLGTLWICAASVFGDAVQGADSGLTRDSAVVLAVENHPEVLAAKQVWIAARGRRMQSNMLPDPELEIEFEEMPGVFDVGQFGQRTVNVTQTIENPVKWYFRSRASGNHTEAVRFSTYEATRLRTALRTKLAFDRVLADQMTLAALREDLELSSSLRNRARIRVDAGDVARLVQLRAEVETARAENALAEAEVRLAVSRADLASLVGRPIPAVLEGELRTVTEIPGLKALQLSAARNRPDLLAAERSLSASRSARSAVAAGWIPDLNLGVGRQTIDTAGRRASFWKASVGLDLPLWAPFRQRGQMIEGTANRVRAEAELASRTQSANLEVASAYLGYELSVKRITTFEERILVLSEEAHRVARESYEQGKATYLDLLSAQQTLNDSRIDHVEALFACQQAITKLEFAVGDDLAAQEAAR